MAYRPDQVLFLVTALRIGTKCPGFAWLFWLEKGCRERLWECVYVALFGHLLREN